MLDTPPSVDALRSVGWLGFGVIVSDRVGGRAGAGGAECHGAAVSRCAGSRSRRPGHRGRRPLWGDPAECARGGCAVTAPAGWPHWRTVRTARPAARTRSRPGSRRRSVSCAARIRGGPGPAGFELAMHCGGGVIRREPQADDPPVGRNLPRTATRNPLDPAIMPRPAGPLRARWVGRRWRFRATDGAARMRPDDPDEEQARKSKRADPGNSGALGGTRTPNLLIRRHLRTVL
jgi:hypothetical protein